MPCLSLLYTCCAATIIASGALASTEYAQVLRMLGNGRLEAACIDGVKRLCHIRGKMRKKVWVSTGDVILLGLRDYQDEKADVILKYAPDEARSLKAYGELPDNFKIDLGVEDDGAEEEEDYVDFDDTDRPDLDLDVRAGDLSVRRSLLTALGGRDGLGAEGCCTSCLRDESASSVDTLLTPLAALPLATGCPGGP